MRYGLVSTAALAALSLSVASGLAQTYSPPSSSTSGGLGSGSLTSGTPAAQPGPGAATPGAQTGSTTLNATQQMRIRESVRTVQPLPSVGFTVAAGTTVPADVRLYEWSSPVVETVPSYRGYRYFVVGQDVVVVEPGSRRIVNVIR